ncbi:MAG: TolC family protein [Proteobacteria bacterium]|nr:MAG: TolC family protein [Pseudomonadota bacterium]
MVTKLFLTSAVIVSVFGSASANAQQDMTCKPGVTLSQKDVAELVLKQGRRTLETNLQFQGYRLALSQSLVNFQWNLLVTSGYLVDRSIGFATPVYDKQDTLTTNVILSKNFTTGTYAGLEYKRTSFKGQPNGLGSTQGVRSVQTQDLLGLNIEQHLWADSLGSADRADVEAANLTYKAQSILRTKSLENVVLDGIRLYWKTFVSERNFREAVSSRDRSKKLADAVQKKSGFGYANPGELSQARADYEGRVQDVKNNSTSYLANLDALNTALNLPQGCEIKFAVSEVIPAVPDLPEKSIDDLRAIKSQKLTATAAERAYDSAKSKDAPTFKLVGKVYTYGVDQDGDGSYSNMASGSNPQYYAGVKLEYPFGSDYLSENRLNRKYARDLEQSRLSRLNQETQDAVAQAQRRVKVTYSAVLSSIEQRKYRERALQELNRSFGQGRTDISIYIEAMNKFSASEIQYSQAIGDYQTALNEWAASRDELIPASSEEQQ